MSRERHDQVVAAYGADARRWPQADRVAGLSPIDGDAAREAALIDAWLDASPTPRVSMALRDRVIASAAAAGRARRFVWDRLALWSGAGWAVATCAGVACGLMLAGHLTETVRADAVLYQASLDGMDDVEVLG